MPRGPTAAIAVGVVIAASALALRLVPYQADDAFIAYRYADHLARGLGPVFNPTDPPVEGFSSPLWVLVLTLGGLVFGSEALPAVGTVLGTLALWGVAVVAVVASLRAAPDVSVTSRIGTGVIAGILATCSPAATSWAATGLESAAFELVVLVFAASLAGGLPRGWAIAAAAIAPWIRPEGPWLAVAAVAQLVGQRRELSSWRRALVGPMLALAIGTAALLAARLVVFDAVLPNTFYAKEPSWAAGVTYVTATLGTWWGGTLTAAAVLGALLGRPAHRGYLAAGAAWIVAAALEGGDWMPYGRFLLPAFGLLALAAAGVAATAAPRLRHRVAIGLATVAVAVNVRAAWRAGNEARASERVMRHELQTVASWVRRSGARSVAIVDIGEIAFGTDLHVFDLAGLTDPRVAAAPGGHLAQRFDLGHLFDTARPDLVVVRLRGVPPRDPNGHLMAAPGLASSEVEARVLADPRIARDYRPVMVQVPAQPRSPFYARMIVRRRDFRLAPEAQVPSDVVAVPSKPASP